MLPLSPEQFLDAVRQYNEAVWPFQIVLKVLAAGKLAVSFWAGVMGLGIIVPLAVSISSFYSGTEASAVLLIIAICSHTVGAFALKYCLLKAGIHQPILQKPEIT